MLCGSSTIWHVLGHVLAAAPLPANAIAGLIWDFYGARVIFIVSACTALLALGAFGLWRARYGRL